MSKVCGAPKTSKNLTASSPPERLFCRISIPDDQTRCWLHGGTGRLTKPRPAYPKRFAA